MTAEYGSGLYTPHFVDDNVTVLPTGGAFSVPQTRTFWLYLFNEAGVSLPSPAVTVTAPVGGRVSVSFPAANRDDATGYKYCFIVASLTTTLDDAWVVGFWRLFQADSDAFATAAPIVFSRDEQLVVPPAAVSLPAGLPTGVSLVPGMVRLVSGGVASGASYYIHYPWLITDPNSPYFRHVVDGNKVIERSPGEYWVRFGNPNFGLFPISGDISGDTGACRPLVAVDEEFLAQNLLFGANYAAADNTDSVVANAKGLIVFFGSDTGDDIGVGSRFGLNVQVDGFPATTLFDRRIVVRFLGFYDPVTGILDEESGLGDGADMEGIGVDLTQTSAETGFLTISKLLPGNQKAVFKIFPRFRASEIYPPLVQGTVLLIVPVLLPQGGVRVPLAAIFETTAGGFVAPIADFGRVVPGEGTLNVLPGLFVVRGHESALQPKQTIVEITPNTLNQQLAVTQGGRAVVRGVAGVQEMSAGEALLALFDFGVGESVAGPWSNNIVLGNAGGISIIATYPVSGAFGQVRSSIAEIGGNTQAHFNPPQVRIYVKQGSTIYRLNSPQSVVIGTTQVFTVTSLTNTTVVAAPDAPPFTDFCLFDPPTAAGSVVGGSLPIGTYQIAIAYSFLSGTQCTRIRQTTADGCIPAYRQSLFESNTSEIIQSIELLSTAGLIERTIGGSTAIVPLSGYIRSFLDDLDAAAARSTLGLGDAATRAIGTSGGELRDAADPAYTDPRSPLSHAGSHLGGGADSLGLGGAAFRAIGTNGGQIRDAADGAYSNARTPTTHASSHVVGGTDPITVFGYLAVSTNSTLTASNQRQLIDVNATASTITITLPAAATVGSGWAVQIRKSDASANLVTISRSGSDTINGAITLPLAVQHQSFILFSLGGTSWGVVAGFPGTLPANTLWGRGAMAGAPEAIASSTFALSSALTTKADLISGIVPNSQLPSYKDVLEFAALVNFPVTGETGKIYVALNTNLIYRWSGSTYIEISVSTGGSTGNFVDLTTNQTIGGIKTFNGSLQLPSSSGTIAGTIWRSGDNLEYKDGTAVTKIILNSAGNLSNLMNKQISLNNLVGTQTAGRVLRSDGTNVTLSLLDLVTDTTGILSIVHGGTGSATQNWVDLTANQSIGGAKTFNGSLIVPTNAGATAGALWKNIDNLEYKDSANITKIILNSAGNLSNLANKQTALNNLVGTQTANRVLRSNGTNTLLAQVDLTTDITGSLPIANGTNFVSKTLSESISGITSFTNTTQATTTTNGSVRYAGGVSVVGNIVTSGSIIKTYAYSFRAAASTTQSLPNNTWTKVILNTEVTDTNNQYDPTTSRLTATTTETWRINTFITVQIVSASTRILLSVWKNGAEVAGTSRLLDIVGNIGAYVSSLTINEFPLIAGDFLEVYCFATPAASLAGESQLIAVSWNGKRVN